MTLVSKLLMYIPELAGASVHAAVEVPGLVLNVSSAQSNVFPSLVRTTVSSTVAPVTTTPRWVSLQPTGSVAPTRISACMIAPASVSEGDQIGQRHRHVEVHVRRDPGHPARVVALPQEPGRPRSGHARRRERRPRARPVRDPQGVRRQLRM